MDKACCAAGVEASKRIIIKMADVMHHIQVAPIIKGSKNVK